MRIKKIISFKELSKIRDKYQNDKVKTVLAHGVFDIFHIGHLLYFKEAKNNNRKLIVSVTSDEFVNKGEARPIFNIKKRIELLSSIDCIDHVVISNSSSAVKVIENLQPNFYIKGKDYKNNKIDLGKNLKEEIKAIKKHKGKFIISKTKLFSSSKIIGKLDNEFINKEIKSFFKKNINLENLKNKILENFSQINKKEKILCVGDPIVDTYNYVTMLGKSAKSNILGKSAKSNILSTKKISQKSYGGGIILVLNFISNFIRNIDYLTYSNPKNDKVLRKFLNKNVKIIKINSTKINIINKIRFVDNYSKNKLFQINENESSDENKDMNVAKKFKNIAKKYDKILIFDFGHNFINKFLINEINKIGKKCYINCQSNSSNFGFNLADKYKLSHALSVDELELRLSTRNKYNSVNEILKNNKKLLSNSNYFIVTQGDRGCYIVRNKKISFIPTLIKRTRDTTGCGDIFFSTFFVSDILGKFNIIETGIICHLAAGLHTGKEGNDNIVNGNVICNFAKTYLN